MPNVSRWARLVPGVAGGSAPSAGRATVAHVIHSLGAGGAEAVLVELARAARSVGMRLVVIGLSDAYEDGRVDRRAVPDRLGG